MSSVTRLSRAVALAQPRPVEKLAILVVALAVVLPACSGATVDSVWDTQFDFSGVNTYDWAPKELETGPELPYDVLDRAIKGAVEQTLGDKGFRQSSENPSFYVTYYVGVEEVTGITDDYYGYGWGGYWGYGWYGPTGVNVSQYDEGSITIDILSPDASVGLVWRGVASGTVDDGIRQNRLERVVRRAVDKILEDFPPPEDA